jgi:hypothetical protein
MGTCEIGQIHASVLKFGEALPKTGNLGRELSTFSEATVALESRTLGRLSQEVNNTGLLVQILLTGPFALSLWRWRSQLQ